MNDMRNLEAVKVKTLADELEEFAAPERILHAVIGDLGDRNTGERDRIPFEPKGKLLEWEIAKKNLDYDYFFGLGNVGCHDLYAWTESHVIFVSQYDGSTTFHKIPRNPCDCMPEMPGG